MVLYINGNYPYHSLHGELVSKLAGLGHEVCVYIPINGTEYIGKYDYNTRGVNVIYRNILSTSDRLFFVKKTRKIVKDIESVVDMTSVDCILAGTAYSDGVPAYLLSKKYKIPFTFAVRETDITVHMKYRPYLKGLLRKVIYSADKIILLSPAYKCYLRRFNLKSEKIVIIPNAINDFWFQNQVPSRTLHNSIGLIYVGEISKRKNLQTSIRVIHELVERNENVVLHIIGSGNQEKECKQLANQLNISKKVFFHGWKNGKEKIKEYYDQADIFIMPSFTETFGTVYIEALSQGIPVLYTKGQGIDGYFSQGEVGYACTPTDVPEISDAVQKIVQSYNDISARCKLNSNRFKWDVVAQSYDCLINSMIKRRKI